MERSQSLAPQEKHGKSKDVKESLEKGRGEEVYSSPLSSPFINCPWSVREFDRNKGGEEFLNWNFPPKYSPHSPLSLCGRDYSGVKFCTLEGKGEEKASPPFIL